MSLCGPQISKIYFEEHKLLLFVKLFFILFKKYNFVTFSLFFQLKNILNYFFCIILLLEIINVLYLFISKQIWVIK